MYDLANRRGFQILVSGLSLAREPSMSFVARRLGSAGLVMNHETTSALDRLDRMDRNADHASGITVRAPMVLAVGVDDEVAVLCSSAAREADVGFVRVAHGVAACREILATRPTVVAIAARLWADERNIVTDVARSVGAVVVELPHTAPPPAQVLTMIRTAIGLDPRCLQAAG